MFPWQVRKQKIISYAKWGLINLVMLCYLLFFVVVFWPHWEHKDRDSCITKMSEWTMVYLGITLVHIVRKIVIICIWKKAVDPTIACVKVDLVCLFLLHLPELAWYIVGNFLLYDNKHHAY